MYVFSEMQNFSLKVFDDAQNLCGLNDEDEHSLHHDFA